MPSLTTRISASAHRSLREISKATGQPMQQVLEHALSEYRRTLFWKQVDVAYKNLRKNSKAWKEEEKERSLWDSTLLDGLDKI